MNNLNLDNFKLYLKSRDLSRMAWSIYSVLPREFKFSMGMQFLESADSVLANISEGYGRFHYKDKMKFFINARGSLYETTTWSRLVLERNLAEEKKALEFQQLANEISAMINAYLRFLKSKAGNKPEFP